MKICNLLTFKFLHTYMSFFLLLNTKEDSLKNVGKQNVDGSHWVFFPPAMEVNGYRQLSGAEHSSNVHLLCSTQETNSYMFVKALGWMADLFFLGVLSL